MPPLVPAAEAAAPADGNARTYSPLSMNTTDDWVELKDPSPAVHDDT
jgi:hypothetical protein